MSLSPRYSAWLRSLGNSQPPEPRPLWFMLWILERAKPYAASRELGVDIRHGWHTVYDHELFDLACDQLADEIYDTLAMKRIEGRT